MTRLKEMGVWVGQDEDNRQPHLRCGRAPLRIRYGAALLETTAGFASIRSTPNGFSQIFDVQEKVKRIGRARLEIELLIPLTSRFVFRMNEERPDAGNVRHLRGPQK